MKRTTIAAGVSAAALATLLAGCSGAETSTDAATSTPSTTASATSTATPVLNVCEDGQITVTDAPKAEKALAKGCDKVFLLTSEAQVTLGPTTTLVIEGSDNTVHGSTIGSVSAMGTGNTVEHTGTAPDATDLGEDNTLTQVQR